MRGGTVSINGSISSQYISALMMIAPGLSDGLTINITGGLVSRPYVEMTAAIMRDFGAQVLCTDNQITIKQGDYQSRTYSIENDWSAASYWYEIRSLIPDVNLRLASLHKNSTQGDSKVAEIFKLFGVETEYTSDGVLLTYNPKSVAERIDIDLQNQPDLAQTIVVTACLKGIPFRISGLSTLSLRESLRILLCIADISKHLCESLFVIFLDKLLRRLQSLLGCVNTLYLSVIIILVNLVVAHTVYRQAVLLVGWHFGWITDSDSRHRDNHFRQFQHIDNLRCVVSCCAEIADAESLAFCCHSEVLSSQQRVYHSR